VDAGTELIHAPELAFVTTKAQDLVDAVCPNVRMLGGIPVVIVQNGLGALDSGRAALPDAHVLGGLAMFASSYLESGRITVTASGSMVIGGDRSDSHLAGLLVQQVLGVVMPVQVSNDVRGAQWTKLLINQVNALPAITGLSVQECVEHPGLLRVLALSMRETIRVGLACGIRFGRVQSLSHLMLRLALLAPPAVTELLPRALARRMGDVPNPGSTLQSIRRGQPTEIDSLNGAVVRAARGVRLDAPVNETLVRLVHEVEMTGKFLTADDVVTRVTSR
jgi:2-dehydropantoate 2-reductase